MEKLFVWNQVPFLDSIIAQQGKSSVVTSQSELEEKIAAGNLPDCLVVLCELNWPSTNSDPSFTGISLIKDLRLFKELTTPVLFVSFFSLKSLLSLQTEIITAIGHSFAQLPLDFGYLDELILEKLSQDGKSLIPLSPIELQDIQSFYCSREGILSSELHNLNKYKGLDHTRTDFRQLQTELAQVVQRLATMYGLNAADASTDFFVRFPQLGEKELHLALEYIRYWAGSLSAEKEQKDATDQGSNLPVYPWKVLMLDDEIGYGHELLNTFSRKGIEVICCNNAQQAYDSLRQDWAGENRIMLVISDYRLYEIHEGLRVHQKIQGYRFLAELASSDQLIMLVAFSGLERRFLLNSFKYFHLRTQVKSKIDYLASPARIEVFCQEMIELAQENWEGIQSLPNTCSGFEKYLLGPYKFFRNHPEYERMEIEISREATRHVKALAAQSSSGQMLQPLAIANIKSPMASAKKDIEMYLKRLNNYFIARRIVLWFHAVKPIFEPTMDMRSIAEIITGQNYPTDAYRQVISTNLGISLEDFPKNITIEERRWLQYDMQLPIFADIESADHCFKLISGYFGTYISQFPGLKNHLQRENLVEYLLYRNKRQAVFFNADFSPVLRSSTDLKLAYILIHKLQRNYNPEASVMDLISKVRYTLLKAAELSHFLLRIFRYFNEIYGQISVSRMKSANPAAGLKDTSILSKRNQRTINDYFELAFDSLRKNLDIARDASADFMLIYSIGFEVKYHMGELLESNKAIFFEKIIEQYNQEFSTKLKTIDDFELERLREFDPDQYD